MKLRPRLVLARFATLSCVLLLGSFLSAAPLPEDPPKPDKELLQGKWSVTAYTVEGATCPADLLKKITVTFSGTKFTIKPGPETSTEKPSGKTTFSLGDGFDATFELGADGATKTIDCWVTVNDKKGGLMGIYRLKGDTLSICFNVEAERPKEFTSKPGSSHRLMELKRTKP
jgi:uncharacterized protein (TIGR03067 family)